MENKTPNQTHNGHPNNDGLTFEPVHNEENVVRAVSFNEGRKQEVYMWVIPEEQFEALIPPTERNGSSAYTVAQ